LKQLLLSLGIATLIGGPLSASTGFVCSGAATAANPCYTSKLTSFATELDWATFGTPDASIHPGLWTSPTASAVIDVGTNLAADVGGLRTADNYADILDATRWRQRSFFSTPQPYGFQGHFDAPPNTAADSAIVPGAPGDHLMGLAANGTTAAGAMTVNFTDKLASLGFRLAANQMSVFDATISIFSGLNGTGLIDTLTLTSSGGGGICTSLSSTSNSPFVPVPCNDAPLVGFIGTAGIKSLTVTTTDATGFYISKLLYTPSSGDIITPEPTSLLLSGFGVALLVFGRRRRRSVQR
jgi:hypothetical protein